MKHWVPSPDASAATLQLIAEYSSDVIALVRADMTFSYISPSAFRLFGRHSSEVIDHSVAEFVFCEDLPRLADATRKVEAGAAGDTLVTVRVIKADGSLLWVEVASRLIGDGVQEQPGDRAVTMRDVSDRKALEDELRAMAMRDGLTGLANRRAFDEALLAAWKSAVREKLPMSLLLLDIDCFKAFNDSYGHQVGDDCLRSVSAALNLPALGPKDLVARYGGEELAIVLPGADAAEAAKVGEAARAAVEGLRIPDGHREGAYVTVSIGVSTALVRNGGSAKMPQALLGSADRALYEAKEAGRNCLRSTVVLAKA